jgi:hypothetical protein
VVTLLTLEPEPLPELLPLEEPEEPSVALDELLVEPEELPLLVPEPSVEPEDVVPVEPVVAPVEPVVVAVEAAATLRASAGSCPVTSTIAISSQDARNSPTAPPTTRRRIIRTRAARACRISCPRGFTGRELGSVIGESSVSVRCPCSEHLVATSQRRERSIRTAYEPAVIAWRTQRSRPFAADSRCYSSHSIIVIGVFDATGYPTAKQLKQIDNRGPSLRPLVSRVSDSGH